MTNRSFELKESERQTLIHCLNVAADQFDRDAISCGDRLAKAFRDQAKTARLWAEKIENAGEVIIR